MLVSVVMPSYLGNYSGAAKNRQAKFRRAVDSVLAQDHREFELVIVADGCTDTAALIPEDDRISAYHIDKQPLWSPVPRNTGIHHAKGDWIAYLDTDDVLGPTHLSTIASQLGEDMQWGVFNDFVWRMKKWKEREVQPKIKHRCGTSNIVHRKGIYWPENANDYAHDWEFLRCLNLLGEPKRMATPDYRVCHVPNQYDV